MGIPQSRSIRFAKMLSVANQLAALEASSKPSGDLSAELDEGKVLSSVKELIEAGNRGLDPVLASITEVARNLTGASGAALAMWKDGAMVCRARSGDASPVLGAQLSANRGISGACLRTGKSHNCVDTATDPRVDREVCRSLGLRSIALSPIHGWRGVNGILEVLSNRAAAFDQKHIALLQELAALAERARASRPQGASPPERRLSVRTR